MIKFERFYYITLTNKNSLDRIDVFFFFHID